MNIGILGNGNVGNVLAEIFHKLGHPVQIGVRDLKDEFEKKHYIEYVGFEDIAEDNEIIVIAVPGNKVEKAISSIKNPEGKIFIDLTNPVGEDFVLTRGRYTSNGEVIQEILKDSHIVKTLNTVGVEKLVEPTVTGKKLTMLIAGNNKIANKKVEELVFEMGFDPMIVGDIHFSRYLEPLAMIWIEMVRKQGKSFENGLVWLR
ncbi:NADPH-dependent F420 reductase [Candidatus Cetobacterium colombiensis]|uniref:NAD(P)-binding domain-containing protein n=1 Tax=Candidatus Cetobacterium colombiensis TaxID=3073100 RepID=A0ABU4W910_9FUSO|nr:NAD(P)-binding domain-containing protein [Candidatus Cetobacterium colombiensis]MDX8336003.1 NAD(P)-binding domain-containing protein [Candidatus Cetobacterium colombiensis]